MQEQFNFLAALDLILKTKDKSNISRIRMAIVKKLLTLSKVLCDEFDVKCDMFGVENNQREAKIIIRLGISNSNDLKEESFFLNYKREKNKKGEITSSGLTNNKTLRDAILNRFSQLIGK